jgi:hypothetical protein
VGLEERSFGILGGCETHMRENFINLMLQAQRSSSKTLLGFYLWWDNLQTLAIK